MVQRTICCKHIFPDKFIYSQYCIDILICKLRKYIFIIIISLTTSCQISGFYTNSSKKAEYEQIICNFENLNDTTSIKCDCLVEIETDELNTLIQKYDNTLVYFWAPYCTGSACLPLKKLYECIETFPYSNVQLIVISKTYDIEYIIPQWKNFPASVYIAKYEPEDGRLLKKAYPNYLKKWLKNDTMQLSNTTFLFKNKKFTASCDTFSCEFLYQNI